MKGSIEKLTWDQLRNKVALVNKTIANLIDHLSPDDSLQLYKVSYPFGTTIVKQGQLQLPNKAGKIVPVSDESIPQEIKKDLAYASGGLPVGLVLKNSYELYIETARAILPVVIATPGATFALWKQLDLQPHFHPIRLFNINAGARSLFMLPNVGETISHNNLKRDYGMNLPAPANLFEQWAIFKSIADHANADWRVELLFLPEQWLIKAKSDPAWHALYIYLLENAWVTSAYERNQIFYEFALSVVQANRNLKPNPYLRDTVKHLLSIAMGATPGFRPAVDETMGPIKLLQQAYLDSYGLKKYTPIMLHPAHFDFNHEDTRPVYYSLQSPTTLAFSPRSRRLSSTLFDLRELKYITETFFEEVKNNHAHLEDTAVGKVVNEIQCRYFHSKEDPHKEIELSDDLFHCDVNFCYDAHQTNAFDYPANAAFLRGCVQPSKKINVSAE